MDLLRLNTIAFTEICNEIDYAIAGISSVDRLNFHLYKNDVSMPEYQCIRALKMSDLVTIETEVRRALNRRECLKFSSPLYFHCKRIAVNMVSESIADEIKTRRNSLLKAIFTKI